MLLRVLTWKLDGPQPGGEALFPFGFSLLPMPTMQTYFALLPRRAELELPCHMHASSSDTHASVQTFPFYILPLLPMPTMQTCFASPPRRAELELPCHMHASSSDTHC